MQMRSVALFALCMFVGVSSHDSARGQTSITPPVSLAPPQTSAPRASRPGIGGPPATPNPAADYDGFSVGTVDDDTASKVTPAVRSRAAKGSRSNPDANERAGQTSADQEDEALKRKLRICQNCK